MSPPRIPMSRAVGGFTLLEVLVAVFIMSLVLTFAFQAYRGIAGAYARVAEDGSRDRSARVLVDRIERELTGAVMIQREEGSDPLLHPYFFFAQPRATEDSSGFELRFVTQTPLRSPGSPPAALALVTYGVVPSDTGPGFTLLRQEEPVPHELVKQVEWTHPQVMVENVSAFTLGFGSEAAIAGGGWDSTSVEQLDQLPDSVDVGVSLWEVGPDGEAWPGDPQARTVDLPVRPFRLSSEETPSQAAECTTGGVSPLACVNQFMPQIVAANPSVGATISDLLSQTKDACWTTDQPSPELERLKQLMRGVDGFDEQVCP